MVRIKFKEVKGNIKGVSITGHADSAEHGQDIVCAAVSVLGQTILLGIMQELGRQIPYQMSSGKLCFELPEELSPEEELKAKALMNTLKLGVYNLKEGYGNYIDITEEEV